MKTSIRDKILKLCLSGLISCAIGVGGFGIYRVNGFVTKHGQDHLQLIAQSEVYRISARLNNIEQYVKTLAYVVQDGLTDIGVLQDSVRREKFTEVNLNFMRATIRNVNSAIAVYLRYNPEFTPPTSGVFLAKTSKNSKIKKQVPTDFSKYDPNDIEHVGWYFVPLYSGQPIWMDPYENKNIDIYMISYVVPLFRFGMEVGVVGVDIDFDYLTREISQIKVLETGFAYLERADGKIAYHPTLEAGSAAVAKDDAVYVRRHLPNGMVLVLEVPKEEITASRNSLIWQISLFTLLLLTVFSVICVRIAKSMAKPLQKLTDAANQLTDGNLDVEFSSASDDEIGELGRSFENARKYMKEYLGYVKGIAYKDSLTGVRNKSAFDNFVRELQQDVDRRLVKKYAVVMLDVNDARRRRRRRWGGMPHGSRVVNRCAVAGDLMAMRLARFRSGCLLRRGGFLMRRGRSLAAARGGSSHRCPANRHTRECRDCHCLDRLVHVTPTFPGFLPLHKARRGKGCFLTEIIIEKILSGITRWRSFL